MNSFLAAVAVAATFGGAALQLTAVNAADADASGPHPPPLPLIQSSVPIEYPSAAAKLGREGRVLLAFGISEQGRATSASILFADDDSFDRAAIELLSGLKFTIPVDWRQSGNPYKRFQLGVVFCIPPSAQSDVFADVTSPIFIMTSRVPGSPVQNPLPAAAPNKAAPAASGTTGGGCATHAKL
jgi:TonB family protein